MAASVDWQGLLVEGYEPLRKAQRVFRRLPHDPRCKMCQVPFGGIGGKVVGLVGRRPSRKNPNLCQYCFDHLPPGGIELDIGVVFADVRGSTALGEQSTATAFADRLNRFYATATEVLISHDGVIDKLIGDEVMAALAALDLAGAIDDVPVGVAANAGVAFVGNVGSGTVMDFTALGDAVNVGARLQSHAAPGEVVLSSELYALVAADHPDARPERVEMRGRDQPVDVVVLSR
jgi:adenylate cyclase